MKHDLAVKYAEEVKWLLKPFVERVEIAGGVRRGKPDPHDIELVAIPKVKDVASGDMDLGTMQPRVVRTNGLDWFMRKVCDPKAGTNFTPAPPNKAGSRAPFSERYYKFLYKGQPVDLFAVLPPAQFGAIFTIRTGDAGYSHKLVQQGYDKGIHEVDGHLEKWTMDGKPVTWIVPCHGMVREVLYTPEEETYFQLLGVPWVPPAQRTTTETTAEEWAATAP